MGFSRGCGGVAIVDNVRVDWMCGYESEIVCVSEGVAWVGAGGCGEVPAVAKIVC